MKILVTGANGQLAHEIFNEIGEKGYLGIGTDITEKLVSHSAYYANNQNIPYIQLDLTDEAKVLSILDSIKPDCIIHCAAWTNVDSAELPENYEAVESINVNGTANLVNYAKRNNVCLIYLSTDYVFDGTGDKPWQASCNDFGPLNFYGVTKLKGEKYVTSNLTRFFVVRTSWLFGIYGNNFVKTMLRLGNQVNEVRVVDDQIGRPTYAVDLARLILNLSDSTSYGIYHASNEGDYVSWYEFCCEIFKLWNIKCKIIPVSTSEYGLNIANRPLNSRLDCSKLANEGFNLLPDWKDALRRFKDSLLQIE